MKSNRRVNTAATLQAVYLVWFFLRITTMCNLSVFGLVFWNRSRMRKQWIPGHFSLRIRGLGTRLIQAGLAPDCVNYPARMREGVKQLGLAVCQFVSPVKNF